MDSTNISLQIDAHIKTFTKVVTDIQNASEVISQFYNDKSEEMASLAQLETVQINTPDDMDVSDDFSSSIPVTPTISGVRGHFVFELPSTATIPRVTDETVTIPLSTFSPLVVQTKSGIAGLTAFHTNTFAPTFGDKLTHLPRVTISRRPSTHGGFLAVGPSPGLQVGDSRPSSEGRMQTLDSQYSELLREQGVLHPVLARLDAVHDKLVQQGGVCIAEVRVYPDDEYLAFTSIGQIHRALQALRTALNRYMGLEVKFLNDVINAEATVMAEVRRAEIATTVNLRDACADLVNGLKDLRFMYD